jgi:hypothetical protein
MLDQTGPQGRGPVTGRGFGPCGRGMGRRMGFGRGLGRYFGWNNPQTKQEKMEDIKAYLKALEEEIEDTKQQLVELSTNNIE